MITVIVTLVTAAIGTGVAFLAVYSGLDDSQTWQILLSLYFIAVLPVSDWIFRSKRKANT